MEYRTIRDAFSTLVSVLAMFCGSNMLVLMQLVLMTLHGTYQPDKASSCTSISTLGSLPSSLPSSRYSSLSFIGRRLCSLNSQLGTLFFPIRKGLGGVEGNCYFQWGGVDEDLLLLNLCLMCYYKFSSPSGNPPNLVPPSGSPPNYTVLFLNSLLKKVKMF